MHVPQWEYKRLLLKANTDSTERTEDRATFLFFGKSDPNLLDWKDDEVAELGRDGWELVAALPVLGGRVKEGPSITWGVTYSIGYSLWFKRPQVS
jgi:hypothetical protein